MQKSCGSCRYFTKMLNTKPGTINGLCEIDDCGVSTDTICTKWKSIKNKRNKYKTRENIKNYFLTETEDE